MTTTLRVLLVEDSATDAKLVIQALRGSERVVEWERVENAADMRAALARQGWDLVLSDWSMPRFNARAALDVLHEARLDVPFIIVSGTIGEDVAVEAMRAGAHDYVLKDRLVRLAPAVDRELRECEVRRAQHRGAEALRLSEARYRRMIETTNQGVWMVDSRGTTTFMNARLRKMLGGDPDGEGYAPTDFTDAEGRAHLAKHVERNRQGFPHQSDICFTRRSGAWCWAQVESTPLHDAAGEYEGSFAMLMDVTARREADQARQDAEAALRESEMQYRVLFDSTPLPKVLYDAQTLRFLAVNEACVEEYGYTREDLLRMTIADIRGPNELESPPGTVEAAPGEPSFGVVRHVRKDGTTFEAEVTARTILYRGRECRLALAQDVTERRQLEDQLRQAQKMEAVGRLAGGVAHDFNNVLSVILSYGEIMRDQLEIDDPLREDVEQIERAGRRAADLTRQLLMFSRQQVIEPKVLDLNEVMESMDKMLERLLGADVTLSWLPAPTLGRVRADRGSLEQVIMNLVVNARDAMPTGGKLTIVTGDVTLDEAYVTAHVGARVGPHVMFAVTDDGVGMDRATQARVFEPFFTTKDPGKGTGLGLSTVFGIVQQSGGSIALRSEPGGGTTFTILLPRVDAGHEEEDEVAAPSARPKRRGSETILLVEDDDQVRRVTREILCREGYRIIEARTPREALDRAATSTRVDIDLLLTDVVMPGMSGPELARELSAVRPGMKVLCMSGYTDDSIVRHGVLASKLAYLQKPIVPDALSRKVREVLGIVDRAPEPPRSRRGPHP